MFKSKSARGFSFDFPAAIAAIWVIAVLTAPTDAQANCVKWGKQCDEKGKNCISVCLEYGGLEDPYKVKTSGETAAPGTVGSDIKGEEKRQKELDKLKVK